MKKFASLVLVLIIVITALSSCSEKITTPGGSLSGLSGIIFDCYRGLGTFKGLELYVWKTGEDAYRCVLMTGTNRNKTAGEIMSLPPATPGEMKSILSEYSIPAENIIVIPIIYPLGGIEWEINDEEIAKLKDMFGSPSVIETLLPLDYESGDYYDFMTFDIDGDGVNEDCTLGRGFTSGAFTFTLSADAGGTVEHSGLFYDEAMNLSFVTRKEKVYVQGITFGGNQRARLFAVSAENGKVTLTEMKDLSAVNPKTHSLDDIKRLGYVVMEDGDVTSGQETWNEFASKAGSGTPASVIYAQYYTLGDASRYDPEYYAEIKDSYPKMFINELTFDGSKYTDICYYDGQKHERTYKYMMKYEGTPTSSTALFSSYTYYVLVNDKNLTWADCENSMLSSDSAAIIDFYKVYSDIVFKK